MRPLDCVLSELDNERLDASPSGLRGEVERWRELILPGTGPWHIDRLRGFLEPVPLPASHVRRGGRLTGGNTGGLGGSVGDRRKGTAIRRLHQRRLVGQ